MEPSNEEADGVALVVRTTSESDEGGSNRIVMARSGSPDASVTSKRNSSDLGREAAV